MKHRISSCAFFTPVFGFMPLTATLLVTKSSFNYRVDTDLVARLLCKRPLIKKFFSIFLALATKWYYRIHNKENPDGFFTFF